MTAPAAMLARRQLRLVALSVLQALPGMAEVESPPVTATAPSQMPYAAVRCGAERKVGATKQQATFTTTSTLEILARVSASTKEAAQDAIEALGYQIEQQLFGAPAFIALVQQVASVSTTTEINGDGSQYQAGIEMSVDCELYEVFDPVLINPGNYPALEGVNLHVDTQRPFDANGIYAGSPFPASIAPAPRASGPDGRDEIAANVDLSQ